MKKTLKTVALLSVMSLTAVSCQKETLITPQGIFENVSTYTLCYTIDGETSQITLVGEVAWNEFVERLIALAEEGHSVSFRQNNQTRSMSKEKVIYTTHDHDDAVAWAVGMAKQGYEVTIDFDEATHTYTCIAIK